MRPSWDFKVTPCCICIEDSSSCKNKNKKNVTSPVLLLPLRRLFTHLLVCCTFPLNWSESCRLHGLPSKHRCEEPLVWTVIPLLKPWAEPYSNTPDAISDSTCATMCSCTPKTTMLSDVQLCLHNLSKTSREGIIEISHFLMMFPRRPVLVELGELPLPHWRLVSHCTCISPGTPLHATRLAQGFASLFSEGEGEEVTADDARLYFLFVG